MNTEKKQWVTPTATEIEVNGGPNGGTFESTNFLGALYSS
jgi:hypothetical protein